MNLLKRIAPHGLGLLGAVVLGGLAYLGVTATADASPPLQEYLLTKDSTEAAETPAAPRPRVVVLMQLSDCLESRPLLQEWSALHEEGRVSVVGVLLDGPFQPGRLADVLEKSGIAFPVKQNGGQALTRFARALGYRATPILMVSDVVGRVRLASPLSEAPAEALVEALQSGPGEAS